MKIRAVILLVCFCSLFNGTDALNDYVKSVYTANQTCSGNKVVDRLKEAGDPSTSTGSNEDCCCNDSTGSVYVLQKSLSYTPIARPSIKPMAHVINHYRTSYLSRVWRPPAVA